MIYLCENEHITNMITLKFYAVDDEQLVTMIIAHNSISKILTHPKFYGRLKSVCGAILLVETAYKCE